MQKNQAARNAATKLIAILQSLGQKLFKEVNLENSLSKYLNFKILLFIQKKPFIKVH